MDVQSGPLLSVVVTARNDNHGGSMLQRMQTFVNAFIGQCRRHELRAELVIVEWNPPADRPRLAEVLHWPDDCGPCDIRILEVPEHLHCRFRHAEAVPLFQMIAKNVGIRRARGRFILATNIDVLMNDALVQFLASGELRRGRMYRIDRHDVRANVPVNGSVEEQLHYCATHLLRLNAREGTFPLTAEGERDLFPVDVARPEDGIRFEEGWFPIDWDEGRAFRWGGQEAVISVRPPPRPHYLLGLEIAPGPSAARSLVKLRVLDETGRVVTRSRVRRPGEIVLPLPVQPGRPQRFRFQILGGGVADRLDARIRNFRIFRCGWVDPVQQPSRVHRTMRLYQRACRRLRKDLTRAREVRSPGRVFRGFCRRVGHYLGRLQKEYSPGPECRYLLQRALRRFHPPQNTSLLHTNACGDFTLMARDDWFALQGNPELEMFSLHLDSVLCNVAHQAGVTETVLTEPMRLYHIEHGTGWSPHSAPDLLERITARGIPVLANKQVLEWAAEMKEENCPIFFNDGYWGLANHLLTETVVADSTHVLSPGSFPR